MKIIEAMKKVKDNKAKIADLQSKIAASSAHLSIETPLYGEDTDKKLLEWAQACDDLSQENIRLNTAIQRTNLATKVTIELGGKQVEKTIAEWVWRRREYAGVDYTTWSQFTDRNLKEGMSQSPSGNMIELKIVRHYDPVKRDEMREMYRSEPSRIDAALEVVNATTDLIES